MVANLSKYADRIILQKVGNPFQQFKFTPTIILLGSSTNNKAIKKNCIDFSLWLFLQN